VTVQAGPEVALTRVRHRDYTYGHPYGHRAFLLRVESLFGSVLEATSRRLGHGARLDRKVTTSSFRYKEILDRNGF